MNWLLSLEGGDDDDIDAAVKIANCAPTDLQEPLQTRWGTVLPSIQLFAEYWVIIYFFMQTLASTGKSNSQLTKMACALLSLMHNYELTPTMDFDDLDLYIEKFKDDTSMLNRTRTKDTPTPILLATVHFLNGFNQAYFSGEYNELPPVVVAYRLRAEISYCCISPFCIDMFNFLKIDDPYLGDNTFGHIARLGPERCSVMHHQLSKLENNGWETKKEFESYRAAYATVANTAVHQYLDKAAAVFFREIQGNIR